MEIKKYKIKYNGKQSMASMGSENKNYQLNLIGENNLTIR